MQVDLIDDGIKCPSCGSVINFEDQARGELTCERCGIVATEKTIVNATARTFSNDDVERKVHYEPLTGSNRVLIIVRKSDGPEARRRASSNNRMPWSEKKVQIMRAEIMKLRTFLPITRMIEEVAMREIKKVFKDESLQGRKIVAMGTALLHYACIQCNSPISFDDIVKYSSEDRKNVRKAITILNKEFNYKFSPKTTYGDYFSRASSDLVLPQFVCTNAIQLFNSIKERGRVIGDPRGLIGATIYYCCKKDKRVEKKTQHDIGTSLGITEITVRKRMKDVDSFMAANQDFAFHI